MASVTEGRQGRSGGSAMGVGLLAALTLMSATAPLSIDTYLPALPSVAGDLHAGTAAVQLSLSSFLVGLAAGQLVLGPLSDRLGRRRPLVVGSAVCVLASLACAVAPSVGLLVAARFLQGLSGAAGVVISRAVVADRASGVRAARIFAAMAAVQGLAPVVAPLIGGLLEPFVGWRGIFWFLTLVTASMAAGALALVGESLPPARRTKGSGLVLVRSMRTVASNGQFLGPALALAFGFGTLFAYISASPFLVQDVMGFSATTFSVVFAVNAVGIAATSAVSARLVARVGARRLMLAGVVSLVGWSALLLVVCLTSDVGDGVGRILALALFLAVSASIGLMFGNATALSLEAASGRAGSASALLGALQFTVGGLASPLAGLGGDATGVPLALTMTGFAVLALASVLGLGRSR